MSLLSEFSVRSLLTQKKSKTLAASKHSSKDYSFEEILGHFEYIEKELRLDQSWVQGVPWWDMVRYPLFTLLLQELGLLERNADPRPTKIKRLLQIGTNLLSLLSLRSPLWLQKHTLLMYGHPRRRLEDGMYVDIYSDPFIELLPSEVRPAILELTEFNEHLKPVKTKKLFHMEGMLTFAGIMSRLRFLRPDREALSKIDALENYINQSFSVRLDVRHYALSRVRHWLGMYPLMRWFFRNKKPTHLFVVVSAFREPIIAAAKSLNIPTYELQHGSPARGKLQYDYSSGLTKVTFPDYFLSFSDFWTKEVVLPIDKQKVIAFGYPYLAKKFADYEATEKENLLIIISQPGLAKGLATLAIDIASKEPGITIEF